MDMFARDSIVTKWDSFEKNVLFFSSLNIDCLLVPLQSNGLLTKTDLQKLKNLVKEDFNSDFETDKAKRCFFRIMKTKGAEAYRKFLTALKSEKEHLGHRSLYVALTRPTGHSISEPAEREKLSFSLGRNKVPLTPGSPTVECLSEESSMEHERLSERVEALEKSMASLSTSQGVVQPPHPAGHKPNKNASEIVGLSSLSLQSVMHLKVSAQVVIFVATCTHVHVIYVVAKRICNTNNLMSKAN